MAVTLEEMVFPTLTVDGREFTIGVMSLHQLVLLKNVATNVIRDARARALIRRRSNRMVALEEAKANKTVILQNFVTDIGATVEELSDSAVGQAVNAWVQQRSTELEEDSGFGDQFGSILDIILALDEEQIRDLARVMLGRKTSSTPSAQWINDHFALDWFVEAITMFLEHNNLASIIKNLTRLGTIISTSASTQATTSASDSTSGEVSS